ncbi:HK97 family phage prohead protease [Streptomyces sp. NPDC055990]|uniref:HK97 family phage prohead protease n=1 Tax=Streptomyces sp. NPDC055990 TaxID=3345672 RepID=UPI0035E1E664
MQDLIVPGAFTRTLAKRRVKPVWSHDWKEPVGVAQEVEEWMPGDPRFAAIPGGSVWPKEAGALVATVQYNLRTTRGRDAYEQVKQWHLSGEAQFSIGYKVTAGGASKRHDGVRVIHDLDLYEISPVLHGAHPMTRSLEVKATSGDDRNLEHKSTWSAVELKAAESMSGNGAMVALQLPKDVAASIAHTDGTSAEHLHITLAYLGDAAELGGHPDDLRDIVTSAAEGGRPLSGTIGGIGRFPDTGDGEPTWVPVDVPGLAELRHSIVEVLGTSVYSEALRSDHGFTPHVTLGYDLADVEPVPPIPVTFDQVAVVLGPDTSFVPLRAELDAPAEPVSPERGAASVEQKSAAQVVLEAKALLARAQRPRSVEHKSAARIVLEAKSVQPPVQESPVTTAMPESYEQLRNRLTDATRALLGPEGGDCYIAVEATYPDRVLASHHRPDQPMVTYEIPYTVVGREIALGAPVAVELTTVAVPIDGHTEEVAGDEAIDARFVQPTATALEGATALIEVSEAGPAHLQHLKPTINKLLYALAKKGLPMTDEKPPPGSSLNLWDSEYDITDGWDDDEETDEPETEPVIPDEDIPADAAPAQTAPSGEDVPEDEEDQQAGEVHLNSAEVKATLAALAI